MKTGLPIAFDVSFTMQYRCSHHVQKFVMLLITSVLIIALSLPGQLPTGSRRASSQGYAMAVRALLLRSLSGSVRSSVHSINAPTVLRTVRHTASAPEQVQGGEPLQSGITLLETSTSAATQEQLLSGVLIDAVEVLHLY